MHHVQFNNLWQRLFPRKTHKSGRPNPRLRIESLEERRMLSLNGITPTLPLTTYDATGQVSYNATTDAFDLSATPLTFLIPPLRLIGGPRSFEIHIQVDDAGNLIGGAPGQDDLVLTGSINVDGVGPPEYTGVLLTGEVTQFGFLEAGVTDLYDFRFTPTGGALMAPYFTGKDIGVTTTSEGSLFADSFLVDFTGGAKGNIGPIDQLAQPSSLAGNVYCDSDNDGLFEPGNGESPIANVTITLTGTDDLNNPVNLVTMTNPSGAYKFENLRPGTYTITETQPAGYFDGKDTIGTPGGTTTNDTFSNIVLGAGVDGTDNNFGELGPSSLAGNVYKDLDNDGLFEPGSGETGIGNVTITLTGTDVNGAPVNLVTMTGPNGAYAFTNLVSGTYSITETQPGGYLDGKDTIGTPGGTTTNDKFSNIVLLACFAGVNNNFGELLPVTISGTKYLDLTGNGLTGDDTGFGGTTIKLYFDTDNNGTRGAGDGAAIATTMSAPGTGAYSFSGLAPGRYFVEETVPTGYIRTFPIFQNYHTVVTTSYGETQTGKNFANFEKCDLDGIKNVYYVINGTTTVTDLRGNVNEGDLVEAHFTVKYGEHPHQYTLVSYTAPSPTFIASEASQQEIFDVDTGVFGPGDHVLTVFVPDCNFQIDFVCGAAIDQLGPAGSNIFYTPQMRLISADNDGTNYCTPDDLVGSISGFVYLDFTNDGQVDFGEEALANVTIKLTGTDMNGAAVSRTTTTDDEGMYFFGNLVPGVYKIVETQPGGYNDGKDTLGDAGGTVGSDKFSNIVLHAGADATDYNFGELEVNTGAIRSGQSATIAYWYGSNGQSLIKCLNGGSNSTALGNWLANNFENLFGSACGSNSTAGKTNAQVASLFKTLYSVSGLKLEAQIMAAAFAVYVTDSDLAGTVAQGFGFRVDTLGLGSATISVGTNGAAFSAADNTKITVMELLLLTNALSWKGKAYDVNHNGTFTTSENNLRTMANTIYNAINTAGGIGS